MAVLQDRQRCLFASRIRLRCLRVNSLFQPTALIPLTTSLNIHNGDERRDLEQEVELLPVEMFIPLRGTVQKRDDQEGKAFIQHRDPGEVFLDWHSVRENVTLYEFQKTPRDIIHSDVDAHVVQPKRR
jgi:hypothetical protein